LPEYQKIYELSKLTRQIENKTNNTSSLKLKKNLRELQEEINALEANSVEMSEYDLQYL
jgi:hypothetical protein